MTKGNEFLTELIEEAKSTRKILERVPMDKPDYKPHPKSMELKKLASHVAELPSWVTMTIDTDGIDFATYEYKLPDPKDTEELLAIFDTAIATASEKLQQISDADMQKVWTMRNGEVVYFSLPKQAVIRVWAMNHLFHHRAQLGVYLRMLDIPVPGVYGPTADEQ